ncbi:MULTISPECIES: STAS domain-containing protein [unclassified Nocardioides]|uniref:STAS domain-containing protein n=1 Tax=unclassified Nocardioides TaxID=2615069 RepID=UPI00361CEA13
MSLHPPRAHLVVTGELDAYASIDLRRRLDDAVASGCTRFTVDASAVTFVDAGGIGTLIRLINAVQPRGGSVEVCAASPDFRWVTAILGLEMVFGLDQLPDKHATSRTNVHRRSSLDPSAAAN